MKKKQHGITYDFVNPNDDKAVERLLQRIAIEKLCALRTGTQAETDVKLISRG